MATEINFSFKDFIKSDKAKQLGIYNFPADPEIIDNWMQLVINCLQPIRRYIGKPMIETSGYRCPKLNEKVGGVSTSQHLKGQALDFVVNGMTPAQVVQKIKASGVAVDECIEEHSGNNHWVHVSYVKGKNRNKFLIYKNGVYTKA